MPSKLVLKSHLLPDDTVRELYDMAILLSPVTSKMLILNYFSTLKSTLKSTKITSIAYRNSKIKSK